MVMVGKSYKGLSIVVPAYNEESGIGSVVNELVMQFKDAEIIVIDDGSTDNTQEHACTAAACHSNVHIYTHLFNRGYGASLKTGMQYASREYVAWFDADSEHRSEDLQEMYKLIKGSSIAAVIGQRKVNVSTWIRTSGKLMIILLAHSLSKSVGSDLNCGLRIFRTNIISSYLSILPQRYSASLTTTILMLERGYPIKFYPVKTRARKGESKVRIKDGFTAMVKVIQLVTLFAPMRLFFKPGGLLFLVGVIYGGYVSLTERSGFPTAGVFIAIIGVLLCILGLIADQISQIRLEQRSPAGITTKVNVDKEHSSNLP